MRKPRARSGILKKLPRAPGGNCAQEGAGPRHDRNLVRRRGPPRPKKQDPPPLGQAPHRGTNGPLPPTNITIILLPPKCPELNPVENVWQFMRDNWLSNRIFKSYD